MTTLCTPTPTRSRPGLPPRESPSNWSSSSSSSRLRSIFAEPDILYDVALGPEFNSRPSPSPPLSLSVSHPRRKSWAHSIDRQHKQRSLGWFNSSYCEDETAEGEASVGVGPPRPRLERTYVSVPANLARGDRDGGGSGSVALSTIRSMMEEEEEDHGEMGEAQEESPKSDGFERREPGDVLLSQRYRSDGAEAEPPPARLSPSPLPAQEGSGKSAAAAAAAAALLFAGIVFSSSLSNVCLQRLNNLRPGCGQLITLLQYVATVLEKSPRASTYLLRPAIPAIYHIAFVVLLFLTAWTSNRSMESGIPFGHFLVVKNTNLVFSMLLGRCVSGRRYDAAQVAGVVSVTVGVVTCVLSRRGENGEEEERDTDDTSTSMTTVATHSKTVSSSLIGPLLCALSTLSVSVLGCLQERALLMYGNALDGNDCGDAADETMFVMHLLGLPFFFLGSGASSIGTHLSALFRPPSSPLSSAALLLANVGATAVLKRCFVGLLGMGEALTATLAVTVSRTLGVVLSELMQNDGNDKGPEKKFWFGALAVAMGSVAYVLGGRDGKNQSEEGKEKEE